MQSKIFPQHNKRQPPYNHPTPNEACPSWDDCSRTCQQVKDGLFLPVIQHVAAYCQSSQYPFCPHYRLRATEQEIAAGSSSSPGDRRRANRVSTHLLFRYSEITIDGSTSETQRDEAWTIDLSETGARFAGTRALHSNATIHFSLEIDDTAQKIEGVGQVIWPEPLANTSLFHTGIAFTERRASFLFPHRHKTNQYRTVQEL